MEPTPNKSTIAKIAMESYIRAITSDPDLKGLDKNHPLMIISSAHIIELVLTAILMQLGAEPQADEDNFVLEKIGATPFGMSALIMPMFNIGIPKEMHISVPTCQDTAPAEHFIISAWHINHAIQTIGKQLAEVEELKMKVKFYESIHREV